MSEYERLSKMRQPRRPRPMINDTDGRKQKWYVIRKRDDSPCEVVEFSSEAAARKVWEAWQANWSDCFLAADHTEIAEINARQAVVVERYRDQRIKHMIQGQAMVASFVISQGGAVNPDDMLRQCDLTLDQIIEAEADDHDINIIRDYLNPQEG